MLPVLKVVFLAVAVMLLVFFGLALQIIFKKGGKFPNTHIGSNEYMKSHGVSCAQTFDRMEQAKARQKNHLKQISMPDGQNISR